MTKDKALKLALEAMEGADNIDVDMHEAIAAIKEALAQPAGHREGYWCANLTCSKCYSADFRFKHTAPPLPVQERNFCPRCGKRTADLTTIHTCTPPRENT